MARLPPVPTRHYLSLRAKMVRNMVAGLEFTEAGGVVTKYPKRPFEPLQLFGLAFGVEAGTALFITDAGRQRLEPFQKPAKVGLSTLPGQVLRALYLRAEAGPTASLPAEPCPRGPRHHL